MIKFINIEIIEYIFINNIMETTCSPICTSCGSTIGHIYPIYYRILAKRVKGALDKKGYSYDNLWNISDVDMEKVLDTLQVRDMCCRNSVMSHMRITKGAV